MAPRFQVSINPKALVWSREALKMPRDKAASKLKLSQAQLAALEEGTASPTLRQFRNIANLYRRPTAFFYLDELPPLPKPVTDFRRASPELSFEPHDALDAFLLARIRRERALELASALDEKISTFGVRANKETPATTLANNIRKRLGIQISEQLGWKLNPYQTLRRWSDAIESAGMIVSQFSDVEVSELRGFSITNQPLPLVCANGKDAPTARLFTLFHELAHVALGNGGFCDLHNDADGWIEPFCNQVAGEELVPTATLETESLVVMHSEPVWTDDDLKGLASRFGVSRLVILRRLLSLNRTSAKLYRQKHNEIVEAARVKKNRGFLLPFKRAIRDNGRRFTGMVVDAYERERISGLELSRLLGGMRLQHLPALVHELRRAA
jgi:Zn-dependent peptidase ImmA (M78 family)/DNA-binding XRE family transcriptional regulator